MKIKNNTIDIIAFTSSIICAIHCAVIPIVLSFSSLGSLHFLENPYIEWTFIALGILFVFMSLWPSYKTNHHQVKPLLFALAGFFLIGIGRFEFTELWEVINTVIGASLVSVAHYFNWKMAKSIEKHKH
ncbi:MerC mercury resistance protein [Tenacibaculum sp. 190130A14a]|uniref:MerC mercury resistance protein n=1 Tax=Tenacibaculum polynesiense TaxID=3137857 RepID=A0ABP1EXH4_9FLAO